MLRLFPLLLVLLALVVGPACTSTPQPIAPPAPLIQTRGLALTATEEGGIAIAAQAGAVDASVSEVSITNYSFDAAGAPSITRVPVNADGSFELTLPDALVGDVYRLVTLGDSGELLGAPLEVTVTSAGLVEVADAGCAVLESEAMLDVGDVLVGESADVRVRITNECETDVTVSALLLIGSEQWTASPTEEQSVAVGETTEAVFTWSPDSQTNEEQLLLLKIDGEVQVIGVTVVGRAL